MCNLLVTIFIFETIVIAVLKTFKNVKIYGFYKIIIFYYMSGELILPYLKTYVFLFLLKYLKKKIIIINL